MQQNAFVDSCVFIAYATEFEEFHSSCITFFEETECEKYTSKYVEGELNKKLDRRTKLYKDYSKYLACGDDDFTPSVYLNNNDKRHQRTYKQFIRHTNS